MAAGRPRQYTNRFDTTVSVEKPLWDIAKGLNITLAEAVSYGLQVLIEAELRYKPDLSDVDLSSYLDLKKSEMFAHNKERARMEAAEATIQTLILEKKTEDQASESLNRLIPIYNDADQRYETIPANLFNPDIHRRVKK